MTTMLDKIAAAAPKLTRIGIIRENIAHLDAAISRGASVKTMLEIVNEEFVKSGLGKISKPTFETYLSRARAENAARESSTSADSTIA